MCTYWHKVREVTAGELWSGSRLHSVIALNLGQYDYLVDVAKLRRSRPVRETLERMTRTVAAAPFGRGLREAADLARTGEHAESSTLPVLRVLPPEGG